MSSAFAMIHPRMFDQLLVKLTPCFHEIKVVCNSSSLSTSFVGLNLIFFLLSLLHSLVCEVEKDKTTIRSRICLSVSNNNMIEVAVFIIFREIANQPLTMETHVVHTQIASEVNGG